MKTSTRTAFEGLQKALDADPDDTVTRQALADWYEEMGDGPRAEFHRALARYRKRPGRMKDLGLVDENHDDSNWYWWSAGPNGGRPAYLGANTIAWALWRRKGDRTRHGAEEGLFAIWPRYRDQILRNWEVEDQWDRGRSS